MHYNVSSVLLVLNIVQLGTKQSMNILSWKCYLFHVTQVSRLWPSGSVCLCAVPQAFSCHPPLRKRERSRAYCWALMRWPPGPNMKQMWKGRSPLPPLQQGLSSQLKVLSLLEPHPVDAWNICLKAADVYQLKRKYQYRPVCACSKVKTRVTWLISRMCCCNRWIGYPWPNCVVQLTKVHVAL